MSESKSASVVFTNSSLLAKNAHKTADNAKSAAEKAQELAYSAQRTADGKNSVYRGSDPNTVPTANLKPGDLYFTNNALYTWTDKGWEKTVSDTTGEEIRAKVEAAMKENEKAAADLKSDVEAKVKNLDDEIAKNKIQTGNALSFYKEQYYLSSSYTELEGGSWSDEVPPRKVEGKYVWSRYVTANVGDPTNHQYSDPVCISGLDGKDGATGPQGPQGVPGPKGVDGQTTYVHVAYANSADGSADFSVNYFDDALYIGVLTDYTQADSTDYTQYTWSRLKGDAGDQGVPGPKGADGRTTYVHFAYANSSDGTINFDVSNSDGKLYIGQYTDYTQADSTNPASYKWTKIKGETGPTGATGPQGPQGEAGADVYYSIYEMSPNQQNIWLTDLTPKVSATNLPKIGSHVIAPSGKVYEVTATYPNANPPQYEVGPQLTSIAGPVGPKGDTGDQGIPGPKGADGRTTYVHFAYANSADGNTNFNTSYFSNALYVGTYTDYTPTDSGDYTKYTWSRLKGDTGATGPKGDTGDTGFFIGTTPPPNPAVGTVWATNDSSGNMNSAKTWNGSAWVSTAFTQDLVAGNITATKIVGGELDVNKFTVKNAQNIPITSTVSLGQKLSDMEQDAKGLTSTVSNMKAGDRNLAHGVASSKDWFDFGGFNNLTNYCLDLVSYSLDTLKAGDTVTFGITMKNDGVTSGTMYFQQHGDVSVWNRDFGGISPQANITDFVPNGAEKALTYTITVTDGMLNGNTSYIIQIITDNVPAGGKLSFKYAFVKKGTLATDWSPAPEDVDASVSQIRQTADGITDYVKKSTGSKILSSILSMDPDNSMIGQLVDGHVVAAINLSKEGKVQIEGKYISLDGDTTIPDATIKSAMIESLEATKITAGILDAKLVTIKHLTADMIAAGILDGMTITGSKFIAKSTNVSVNGSYYSSYQVTIDNSGLAINADDCYSQFNGRGWRLSYVKIADIDYRVINANLGDGGSNPYIELIKNGSTTHIDSNTISSNDAQLASWHFTGFQARANGSLYVANQNGTNFDGNGDVGFQVWSGIGLGKNTIYMPSGNLYIQQGNCGPGLGASYSSSGKVDVHCNSVISQKANTVSSRLSVKTDISKVTYDRALAAVEDTDMYDYRYVSDDSGQHYVSGIIDDINPEPQYHMDGMLINKERTARIDANLVGYHHVVIQKLLERVAALEETLEEKTK